jgi:hypothetical protein
MRTTVLAYVIAVLGFVMIGGGGLRLFLFVASASADVHSTEILRDGNWHDPWRICHGRHCAGFAPTGGDCACCVDRSRPPS